MKIVIDIDEEDYNRIKDIPDAFDSLTSRTYKAIKNGTPLPKHGRLIDADALNEAMYHESFETDTDMQKWDSGCWIRYKMFENAIGDASTIIEADKVG